jgi:predicted ATPase/class 3 adenylate cyclase
VAELPTGTVTFLFTDVEGSTRLLQELGDGYAGVLAEHRRVLRKAFARYGGVEVDTQGDAFFVAFERARDALAAAAECHSALAAGPVRVRIGIHTGESLLTEEGYVGIDVHRAARIMSSGHGGQVLLSEQTYALLDGGDLLTDLGLHRLKDMSRPEKLFQLGEEEFPPLKTLDATNLPVAASPLLGRERELGELGNVLDERRLVTVTGPGGTGKTRLALQVAADLVGSLKDGVFWVPLADLADPRLVLPTIAQTLGARDGLDEFIRGKELLLLLDNFEHLLPAGPGVGELLAGSRSLRLLVTSRAALHLSGEQEFPLEPLRSSDAVALFLERSREAGRLLMRDDIVEAICRRLDGLPLAIELAAARTKLLEPKTLLQRLENALAVLTTGARDAPERQRTLRATIEWSHDLLDEEAKHLFARLAVFAGTFSLSAAETICAADLDLLQTLVEESLLKPTAGDRYWMLATIREYAADRLDETDDAMELRRRHAEFFARLAEEAEREVGSHAVRHALAEDEPNFRAALTFCVEAHEPELMLRLAGGLSFFWARRGQFEEGKRWLEEAIAAATPSEPRARARGLRGLASMCGAVGEFTRAGSFLEEALDIYRKLGDDGGVGRCLNNLGFNAWRQGDPDAAEAMFEESFAIAPGAVPLENLTHLALARGEFAQARTLADKTLNVARETGDDVLALAARRNLASLAALEQRYDAAAGQTRELLGDLQDRDLPQESVECMLVAAFITWKQGNEGAAARLVRAAIAERTRLGMTAWESPAYPCAHALAHGLEQNGHQLSGREEGSLTFDEAVELALRCLDN